MKYRTGDDMDAGSKFLTLPGCYHFVVAFVREPASTKDGAPIAGGLFTTGLAVLAGGDGNQANKTLDLTFFEPSMDAKDGGKFQRKKIDRFLVAMSLITEDDTDKEIDIDVTQCTGRQCCIKLESNKRTGKDGKEYDRLDVHFADIYHVDDPEVATWTRDVKALGMIPAKLRRLPSKNGSPAAAKEVASKPAAAVDALDI